MFRLTILLRKRRNQVSEIGDFLFDDVTNGVLFAVKVASDEVSAYIFQERVFAYVSTPFQIIPDARCFVHVGPVAQRQSRGLIIPWSQVRILAGPF
jgi:hypothetical protein